MIGYSVKSIKRDETLTWLKDMHYAKRVPMIMYAFGLYCKDTLKGVITYGKPVSKDLCICICGEKYKSEAVLPTPAKRATTRGNKNRVC